MQRIHLLAPLAVVLMLSACSGYLLNSNPSATPTMAESGSRADSALADNVARALASDSRFADVVAAAGNRSGEVVLKGRVASFEARDDAVSIARNIGGVGTVNNQIEVNTRN